MSNLESLAFYTIGKYDQLCEEHFKIIKIIPIRKSCRKITLNIIFNIITSGIIQLIYGIFPNFKKLICYDDCSLKECEKLYIICADGKFYFEDIIKYILPKIENQDLIISQLEDNSELILFKFKLFTYIFNFSTNQFDSLRFEMTNTKQYILEKMIDGLKDDEHQYQSTIYGKADLIFPVKSFFKTLYFNMCDFFFIFQVFAILLWFFTDFKIYGSIISLLVLYNLIDSTIETRSNLIKLRQMSKYSVEIKLLKEGKIEKIDSADLVPGDVFVLPKNGNSVPCDCVLLTGSVIVNEAMLTGESTPIIKTHIQDTNKKLDYKNDYKHILYYGTNIVQKRAENKQPILCLCYSTGFNTVRGNLIRSVIYPKEGDNSFLVDSFKFLKIIGLIFAFGFLVILPIKIRRIVKSNEKKELIKELVTDILDLLTQAIPPELPLCLGICLGIAQKRCKERKIICINKEKINSAGKINVCVFDKTGTLTKDHLNIFAFLPVSILPSKNKNENQKKFVFGNEAKSIQKMTETSYHYYKKRIKDKSIKSASKEIELLFVECLACCQGATKVDNKLIGDPIDVEMFESTGWNLVEDANDPDNYDSSISTYVRPKLEKSLTEKLESYKGNVNEENHVEIDEIILNHYELGIVRRFDFESKLQRMSTIVKNIPETNFLCFCKGSPEKISELCNENTLPDNFNEVLNKYTSKGYRVLALSCKVMRMTYDQAMKISRNNIEKNLIFLGLLIIQNELKEGTAETLKSLNEEGHLLIRMATGDNILTATCVAKSCNLIPNDSLVYNCEMKEQLVNESEGFDNKKESINEDIIQINKIGDRNKNKQLEEEVGTQKKMKKLVWKLVENLNELDEDNMTYAIPDRSVNNSKANSTQQSLSVLVPQEIEEEPYSTSRLSNLIHMKSKNSRKIDDDDLVDINLEDIPFSKEQDDIIIATSGKTFEILYNLNQKYEKLDKETKPSFKIYNDVFRLVLKNCAIYGRCSPDNKTQLVTSLQNEGFQVLMCGDGANDCGALKAADVGISLSQEEASIAAPFTSTESDISCIINVLNQGKCALITSVEIFKYMIVFSLTEYFSMILMLIRNTFLSDFEGLWIDLIITLPLSTLLPLTDAYHKLNHNRPFYELTSFPVALSIFSQFIINILFQLGGYLVMDSLFEQNKYPKVRNCLNKDICLDNSIIFYISFCQYLFSGIVFINSTPYKKKIYSNLLLFIFLIFSFSYTFYIILYNDKFSRKYLKIIGFPDDKDYKEDIGDKKDAPHFWIKFKFYLCIYCFFNFLICLIFEKIIVKCLISKWLKMKHNKNKKKFQKNENELKLDIINDINIYEKVKY